MTTRTRSKDVKSTFNIKRKIKKNLNHLITIERTNSTFVQMIVNYNWLDHDRKNKLDARANQAYPWQFKPMIHCPVQRQKRIFIQL